MLEALGGTFGWSRMPASATLAPMRFALPALALSLAWLAPSIAGAQDEVAEEPAVPASDEPSLELEEEPLPEPPRDEPETPPEEERQLPVLESPTQRTPPREETIEELEEQLAPTLTLPEWRIRAGGGIAIATAGLSGIGGRITQEVEWQPTALQFISFGVGAAETIADSTTLVQAGLRVGGFAWFCEDRVVRCQGAIAIQLGVVAGTVGAAFDFSGDVDLRFLFSEVIELHVRGGFFSVNMSSFVNVTAGLGVAF